MEQGFDSRKDATKDEGARARRWILEIQMAKKREKDWRTTSKGIWDKYRGANKKKNSFNILWANTEVLRPALLNSPPKPDVRRRFRSSDKLGKAVSEVLERGISYTCDAYDFYEVMKDDVLDALLPGRGVSWVRYIPSIKQDAPVLAAEGEAPSEEQSEEELDYEQVICEHVQWDQFLHGPGRSWKEVPWVAREHDMTKDDAEDKFGEEVVKKLKFQEVKDDGLEREDNRDLHDIFKVVKVWEVWDKIGKKVFFIQEDFKESPLYSVEHKDGTPPLNFRKFFPCAQPLMAVEDSSSTLPTPLYSQYEEQAEELDRISGRINKLINQMRVRGIYDSVLSELSELMKSDDGDLTPAENTAKLYALNGDLSKAVWMMPIDTLAIVLKELYLARDQAKAAIYEITGISDIVRGDTNANETLGAQQLKANYSNIRLSRLQKEVQRYIRDVIRLISEVIGEQFEVQTLAQMTGLQFPTQQQKMQAQALAAQFQQSGQQPQPQQVEQFQMMMSLPTWEEIKQVMSSDFSREYRVDVETDSTVAQTLSEDMQGMREVMTGIVQFWQGAGEAVMSGAVKMDAVKAITLAVARRAKLGLEVEDALETGMQQPQPPQPEEDKTAAIQAKSDQDKLAFEQQKHQDEMAFQSQQHQDEMALQHKKQDDEVALQRYKVDNQADTDRQLGHAKVAASKEDKGPMVSIDAEDSMGKVAETLTGMVQAMVQANQDAAAMLSQTMQLMQQTLAQMGEHSADMAAAAKAPKRVTQRDKSGRIAEVAPVIQ